MKPRTLPAIRPFAVPFARIAFTGIFSVLALLLDAAGGSTPGTARLLPPDTVNSYLDPGGSNWYRFTVQSMGRVVIYTQGFTNTNGRLFDESGQTTVTQGINSNDGHNFWINTQLAPGTYLLRVNAGSGGATSGAYSLTLRTQESAPWVDGSSFSGQLSPGQINFYRIRVETAGRFEVYTTGLTSNEGVLYNQAGTGIGSNTGWGAVGNNFRITIASLQAGDYLVRVRAATSGANSGFYEGFVLRPEDAEPVGSGSYARSLSPRGDIDHYRFEMPSRGTARIWTTGTTDTVGQLYRFGGASVGSHYSSGGSGHNFLMNRQLDEGTYLLSVVAGNAGNPTGDYTLHLELPGAVSPPGGSDAVQRSRLARQLSKARKQLRKVSRPAAKKKIRKKIRLLRSRLARL